MGARALTTVVDHLQAWAGDRPGDLAFVVDGTERMTNDELLARSGRAAGHLARVGLGPTDVVAISLPTSTSAIAAVFGAQWIGAIPVVVDPAVAAPVVAGWLDRLGCTTVIAIDEAAADLAASGLRVVAPEDLDENGDVPPVAAAHADDIVYLQLTSGTTGEPQASAIPHRALAAQLDALAIALATRDDDVHVSWLPLHHDMGLVSMVLFPVARRLTCHLLQPSLRSLPAWLRTIDSAGGTVVAAPDFGYRAASRLDPTSCSLASLRVAVSGAEPVRRSTVEAFETAFGLGPVVRPAYGLGEATLAVSMSRPGTERRWTDSGIAGCGPPLQGLEIEVRAPDGQPCEADVTGEIHLRGESLFTGYWRDDDATRAVLVDGWFATGDLGHLDARGELFVTGRVRAMIKRAGHLVPARAVEELVDQVPGIRRSAAFGSAGERERLVVVAEVEIVPADEATGADPSLERAVAKAVQAGLGFGPDQVLLVGRRQIPLTGSGKTRYDELRRRHHAGEIAVIGAAPPG